MRHDRYSRCACEVMATKGKIFVCGEITCAAKINIRSVVREVLRKVGYLSLIHILLHDFKCCVYSTHKHTPEHPRLRMIIPLAHDITEEEYPAVARMVAKEIGIDLFDDTTYEEMCIRDRH